MKILIVVAHPDDEVLGCGGTIARLASEGHDVRILILASGLTSRTTFDKSRTVELLRIHEERARKAGELLGAKEVTLTGLPDQRMDSIPIIEVTQIIEREIHRTTPETILTHHGGDLNLDHVITFRAVLTATRPPSSSAVKRLLSFEVPSSTEWAFHKFSPPFHPQIFYNIAPWLDLKIQAMNTYESEVRAFPHPRSAEALRAIAARWGTVTGLPAVEAFEMVREVVA